MDSLGQRSGRVQPSAAATETPAFWSPVVELRQYRLHPGRRDDLIELFDRELVEPQEAAGMRVIGQFRDCDDPDLFVWLRGFPAMGARTRALEEFYGGPAWAAHRDEANATMVAFDDVRLLRPTTPSSGFVLSTPRPSPGASEPAGLVACHVHPLRERVDAALQDLFDGELVPAAEAAGARILASFVTEECPNTYPALPVREGEPVLAWFAGFADVPAYERTRDELARSPRWRQAWSKLLDRSTAPPEIRRLQPTARSQLRSW
jgi:hypothetical protein